MERNQGTSPAAVNHANENVDFGCRSGSVMHACTVFILILCQHTLINGRAAVLFAQDISVTLQLGIRGVFWSPLCWVRSQRSSEGLWWIMRVTLTSSDGWWHYSGCSPKGSGMPLEMRIQELGSLWKQTALEGANECEQDVERLESITKSGDVESEFPLNFLSNFLSTKVWLRVKSSQPPKGNSTKTTVATVFINCDWEWCFKQEEVRHWPHLQNQHS